MAAARRSPTPRHHAPGFVASLGLHVVALVVVLLGRAAAEPAPPSAEGDAGLAETDEPGGELVAVASADEPTVNIHSIGIIDESVPAAPAPPSDTPPTPQSPSEELPLPKVADVAPIADTPPPAPEPAPAPVAPPAEVSPPPAETTGNADVPPPQDDTDQVADKTTQPRGRKGHRTPRAGTGDDKCPPPVNNIEALDEGHFLIERPFVEYYARHVSELMKLGSVWAHKGKDGQPDGFRVGLSKCSVLRQGGLRSGDIVHDINGIQIDNVLEAVGAYFKLHKEENIQVHLSRRGKPVELSFEIQQKLKKKK